ncbi:MAG TPA: hypothetical protein DIW43_16120 [Spongiibacteraceae bacterium]|nr:hypothetical protein [Spongiibacteraceae bacterium]HCS28985.1 hypothetical protein [Spongiibacteraceae bacterium]|tara:strand:+ start:2084 stop:2617 length:534 start_codon:yes stop_codon:yes gene_type:complete
MKQALLILALLSAPAFANDLSFQFSDDVAGIALNANSPDGKASVGFGADHNEDDDVQIYNAGFYANGQRGRLEGRVGVKGFYADLDKAEGPGLAFGVDLKVPSSDVFSLVFSYFYGPSSTSFDDMDGYRDWKIGAQIMLFENSALEFGFSDVEVEVENVRGEYDFQDGAYVKLQLIF